MSAIWPISPNPEMEPHRLRRLTITIDIWHTPGDTNFQKHILDYLLFLFLKETLRLKVIKEKNIKVFEFREMLKIYKEKSQLVSLSLSVQRHAKKL